MLHRTKMTGLEALEVVRGDQTETQSSSRSGETDKTDDTVLQSSTFIFLDKDFKPLKSAFSQIANS
jgi:hypothetical protein